MFTLGLHYGVVGIHRAILTGRSFRPKQGVPQIKKAGSKPCLFAETEKLLLGRGRLAIFMIFVFLDFAIHFGRVFFRVIGRESGD